MLNPMRDHSVILRIMHSRRRPVIQAPPTNRTTATESATISHATQISSTLRHIIVHRLRGSAIHGPIGRGPKNLAFAATLSEFVGDMTQL
jgi:hypothetical protein